MQIYRKPLVAQEEPHVLVMRGPLRISGAVVDADTGEPIDTFKLMYGHRSSGNTEIYWQ